jgi:hypothetical protein
LLGDTMRRAGAMATRLDDPGCHAPVSFHSRPRRCWRDDAA